MSEPERAFALDEREAPAAELVSALPVCADRRAFLCRPRVPALVIGSSQPLASVDTRACDAGGYEVVRRRSGGGAVVVAPGAQVWLDLFVPAGDVLFERDVNRAAHLVGEIWVDALSRLGPSDVDLRVHTGANEVNEFSRIACFAGIGPGEVHLARRKVVGLSQRRSRAGAWFFSMALVAPRHLDLADLLRLEPRGRERLEAALTNDVAVLGHRSGALEGALAAALGSG